MTGRFHCKEGRQEEEELSAVSLNTGPQQGRVTVNRHNTSKALGAGGTNRLNHVSLFDLTWLLLVADMLS